MNAVVAQLRRGFRFRLPAWSVALIGWASAAPLSAAEAVFYRAVNLNGPALVIDGRPWESKDTTNVTATGNAFENQAVPLKPVTDPERAKMIRSSR